MEAFRVTGNTVTLSSTANSIPLANVYNISNASFGATCILLYYASNANGAPASVLLNNTAGTWTFTVPGSTPIVLQKNSLDTVNTSASGVTAQPIQKGP